ncbi:hypothetical protein M3P21_21055 [Ruegeria sp. 2012CJ41-6]|uniref:HNH endonuclease 5 domain-containing protein n=1 Tax=Ruegeria spongiae TaxID=2942209 RepID=A0ABT0Q868_9RHOB|nr:hypothetical protein [Ruegeria spongiae]MCL6286008.1 hypothetical protein [Ruegeria spongiae]
MARNANKKILLQENRFCIYCGVDEPSTTWDHMPNKGMFPKDRPSGLEFPSCEKCNQGSKWFEDIASFIGSVQWSSVEGHITDHFEAKLGHLVRNHPDALEEMQPSISQSRRARKITDHDGNHAGALNLTGPIVSEAMLLYGAKLGLALHWETTGEVLPPSGKVGVIWFSNENAILDEVPQHLFELLPQGKQLRQGTKVSKYPFEYQSAKANDAVTTAHWATFSGAFMYYLFVSESMDFSVLPEENIHRPGCLRSPKPHSTRVGWSIGPVTLPLRND